MRATSPLTGLPGNNRIEEEIAERVATNASFAVCYFDLDNFKAFNDRYGFLRGDDVITLLATALRRASGEAGEPAPFIGHIGGDDFVAICQREQAEPLARQVIETFDAAAPRLHDHDDAARGFLELTDRQGTARQYPLVAVSVGVVMSGEGSYADHREVAEVATEMKKVAKRTVGSSIAVDRRSLPAG